MKRFRSSEDLDSFEEKGVFKDWGRRDDEPSMSRSSSHRNFHYKPENGRNGVSSSFSSRYDRVEDNRETSRVVRKRSDYEDGYDRRMGNDRYRDGSERGILSSSPRSGYSGDRIHRSESFSRSPRREIPKGFRSERDRPRREGSVSSWQRFGKDINDNTLGGNHVGSEEKGNMKFSPKMREGKSSPCSRDSGSEQSKITRRKDLESEQSKSTKVKDFESAQSKSTKLKDFESAQSKSTKLKDFENAHSKSTKVKDFESEQLKSTKMKDLGSVQSKSTKMKDLASVQSTSTKMKDLESVQSKSTKMKGLGSEKSKSTVVKDMESEHSKYTKKKNLESQQFKSTNKKVLASEQLKYAKNKESESEQFKIIKNKDLESEQLNNTKKKDLESEQTTSTKLKDLEIEETKYTKLKDLESEQIKSTEMIKIESLPIESGCSSEMEEGELEPEPKSEARGANVILQNELESEELGDSKLAQDEAKSVSLVVLFKDGIGRESGEEDVKSLTELKSCKDDVYDDKLKFESHECAEDLVKGLPFNQDAFESTDIEGSKEEKKDDPIEELISGIKKHEEDSSANQEDEVVDTGVANPKMDVCQGNEVHEVALCERIYGISPSFKDKGKNVVTSPSNDTGFDKEMVRVPRESNHLLNFEPYDIEGPSTMGLDLFLNHPVKQPEKLKEEKLELEPFDLSLSLPDVLLPIDSHKRGLAPSSPSHARSVQSIPSSFRTNSDGFTASMSFTGSQSFRHNASCSLTNNPLDQFEHSVSSRPLFGPASIWQAQPSNEQIQKEVPIFQNALSNVDGFPIQDQQVNDVQKISVPSELNRQLSLHKQLSMNSRQNSGSHDNRSDFRTDKNRVMRGKVSSSLYEENNRKEEQFVRGRADSVEPIINLIVSEPVLVITKKFNEMSEQAIITIKEGVRDIVVNGGKRCQLSLLQKALINRSDITLEMLLKANRALLEVLVALKTGVGEFLSRNQNISNSDIAEIYLNLRCRNLTCRSHLPVDECDCKVCSQNNGFCSNCMCLVCSKYDMASNTCSWVGCDVCLHWCHADCALRESYIRSGRIFCGTHEVKEMQFHCVACDHPSEMFGFVKEVFQTFAKEWTGEKLSKELEYVKKIFSASEDMRGKRLHETALMMLLRLANKSNLQEVQNHITSFFAESRSMESNDATVRSGKALFNTNHEVSVSNKISDTWPKTFPSEKAPQIENASTFKSYTNNNTVADLSLQRSYSKEHDFDELDSVVRIKEAEANMFQTRADDARREAEGLKRIATTKYQRIEEEYASRVSKLRLLEAEEKRKQKIEELQGVEKVYREYFNIKMRMEADIGDLLSKMEATKRNLAL